MGPAIHYILCYKVSSHSIVTGPMIDYSNENAKAPKLTQYKNTYPQGNSFSTKVYAAIPGSTILHPNCQVSSVQSLSCEQFFATPWTAACQASLSITTSWSLLKLMYIEPVMPSNHPSKTQFYFM